MKKIIILLFITLVFFITVASPIYAGKESSFLPPWFIDAIKPLRDSISSLFQRTDSHEARIAELEKKFDFEIPTQWSAEFYESSQPETKIVMHPANNCTWYGGIIGSYVTTRAIAHLSTGDMFGVGTCGEITFKSNVILTSGTAFETDIYLWWQGTEKHTKQTTTIPERPFLSLLTINNGGSLLIGPSSLNGVFTQGTGGALYYQNNPVGIGTTSATQQLIIDCGIYNCSDLLKLNN